MYTYRYNTYNMIKVYFYHHRYQIHVQGCKGTALVWSLVKRPYNCIMVYYVNEKKKCVGNIIVIYNN